MRPSRITRRTCLKAAAAAGGLMILPEGLARGYAANEKLNLAVVGCGIGAFNAKKLAELGENIAALCDCDGGRLEGWGRGYPQAKRYTDFRKMLEGERLDGIVVATPDHTHAAISIMAMKMGLHCFCQKPLTYNIDEARRMAQVAAEKKVITQMGTDSQSGVHQLQIKKLIQSGALGGVTEVHLWTNRPIWLQGADRPQGSETPPAGLDWDLWLGPAPLRPFVSKWPANHPARKLASFKQEQVYHPFVWRGWWDFGTGALGDIAPHAMNSLYFALDLGAPSSAEVVESSGLTAEMFPEWEVIRFDFPARGNQPPVKVFWYDGGKKPPKEIGEDGPIYIGSKASWPVGRGPFFGQKVEPIALPAVAPGEWDREEVHKDWVRGIRNGQQPGCHFGYSGPFTEAYLLGNIALKVGQRVEWDSKALRVTNCPAANQYVKREYRKGWEL
jgi:predicted dehydrogenase